METENLVALHHRSQILDFHFPWLFTDQEEFSQIIWKQTKTPDPVEFKKNLFERDPEKKSQTFPDFLDYFLFPRTFPGVFQATLVL